MEALSLISSGLTEKLSEYDNGKEMILKFNTKLIIRQYPQVFDPSSEQDSKTVSLKDFYDRNGEQVKEIVIAYVCTILRSTFLKSILTVSPSGSEFPACMSLWVQVSVASHRTTLC